MKRLSILSIVCFGLLFSTSNAFAEDFEENIELNRKSRSFEMGTKTIPLLEMKQRPGNSPVMVKMLEKFGPQNDNAGSINTDVSITDDDSFTECDDKNCVVNNNGWVLMVSGDGTRVAYINEHENQKIKAEKDVIESGKIKMSRLKEIGKAFIKRHLSDIIDSKELTPQHVMYGVEYNYDVQTSVEDEAVVENYVIFSRKINGIDVIGSGSKISVMFTNDETPVAFRYDWPQYTTSEFEQETIDKDQFKNRKSALSIMNENATGVKLQRFECGYYDPGYDLRDDGFIAQTACAAFYEGNVNGAEIATMDMIPIGHIDDIIYEPNWDTANVLLGEGDFSYETDVTDVPIGVDEPQD